MNVYGRLIQARKKFLEMGIDKSGKNRAIQYDYFELADIVPNAIKVFEEVGLVTIFNLYEAHATMRVINVDEPNDEILFTSPIRWLEGNKGMNDLQVLGSIHTYMRRYMYLNVLDVVEADAIDSGINVPTTTPTKTNTPKSEAKPTQKAEAPKKQKPVSEAERKDIKKEVVDADGKIDQAMIDVLITKTKDILTKCPDKKQTMSDILKKTVNFTEIKKSEYQKYIETFDKLIGEN